MAQDGRRHSCAWYAGTGQDKYTDDGDDLNDLSRAGEPQFVDINGADNVLGYTTAGTGYDGGPDDNFYLKAYSPAIDRADAWAAPATDIAGYGRVEDEPSPNQGSTDYTEDPLGSSLFAAIGTPQNWRSNNTYWNYTLPFQFSFYGVGYTAATVSTEGFLKFSGSLSAGDGTNTESKLRQNVIIAPLLGQPENQRHRRRHLHRHRNVRASDDSVGCNERGRQQ